MSNILKWVIIILAVAGVTLLVFFIGELFGKTLGPVPTFMIWVAISAIGWKWTHPKSETATEDDNGSSES